MTFCSGTALVVLLIARQQEQVTQCVLYPKEVVHHDVFILDDNASGNRLYCAVLSGKKTDKGGGASIYLSYRAFLSARTASQGQGEWESEIFSLAPLIY